MTILIFSAKKNDPSLIAQTTRATLQTLYPDRLVDYSENFDLCDQRSDTGFTLVLPGQMLYALDYELKKSGARDRCIEEVKDNHHHFIGFCAGAFYGAGKLVASKDFKNPFFRFDHDATSSRVGENFSLGMIEEATALGPFKAYESAIVAEPFTFSSQAIKLQAGESKFNSLYMEGPLFFNSDLTGPYDKQECVVANYQLNYQPELEVVYQNSSRKLQITAPVPAILHEQVKGSHRYLIGPHPELASRARTFMPAIEKQYSGGLIKLPESDRNLLLTEEAENDNLEFLRKTFKI
jgi:glutamine amidotransferase-like uncharacterized protein